MEKGAMPKAEAFLDSSYAIALSAPTDQYHQRAIELAERIERDGVRLVTTRAVSLEIGNALAEQRYRAAAILLLSALEADPNIEVVPLSESLYKRAFEMYQHRPDKEWA
jgi:uncharacterized protein